MILIVDDKQENLYSLKSLLELHGYEVHTANSGEEALKRILKFNYALIMLDVQMPGMDGYEVAEAVTGFSKTKNIPIIFLSAVNIDKSFITRGYLAGAVDYIVKPFDPDLLLLKVKTLFRLHTQTEELKRIQETLKREIEVRKEAENALQQMNVLLEEKVKERTRELSEINHDLESTNVELQQYAFVASHDLQEPLRKITTFSNLITEKFSDKVPDANPYLNKIITSTIRMRSLINDLLVYSGLSSQVNFESTDLNEILNETISDLELPIEDKKAEINFNEMPVADVIPGQIRQVFQNIISNALKFSKAGHSPRINIITQLIQDKSFEAPSGDAGDYLRITFTDNGIGFDTKYIEKIFTIFQRLHPKAAYEGTGIGLAIVKKIIEKHNGLITASSVVGEGSVFKIILPLKQPKNNSQPD